MGKSSFMDSYEAQLLTVKSIISETNSRVIADPPDPLFLGNTNFFVKSYLVIICSYLEAYLQDVAYEYASLLSQRLNSVNAPKNFVYWRVLADKFSPSDAASEIVNFVVSRDDISEVISPNPHKTLKLFERLGINLMDVEDFRNYKPIVGSVVSKRNSIVHHNDQASDITLTDLSNYIDTFLMYIRAIDEKLF